MDALKVNGVLITYSWKENKYFPNNITIANT